MAYIAFGHEKDKTEVTHRVGISDRREGFRKALRDEGFVIYLSVTGLTFSKLIDKTVEEFSEYIVDTVSFPPEWDNIIDYVLYHACDLENELKEAEKAEKLQKSMQKARKKEAEDDRLLRKYRELQKKSKKTY